MSGSEVFTPWPISGFLAAMVTQPVGTDLDEGTERAAGEPVHGAGQRAQHQQAAGRRGGDLKEIAALHQAAPPAARWIAARIRW